MIKADSLISVNDSIKGLSLKKMRWFNYNYNFKFILGVSCFRARNGNCCI